MKLALKRAHPQWQAANQVLVRTHQAVNLVLLVAPVHPAHLHPAVAQVLLAVVLAQAAVLQVHLLVVHHQVVLAKHLLIEMPGPS